MRSLIGSGLIVAASAFVACSSPSTNPRAGGQPAPSSSAATPPGGSSSSGSGSSSGAGTGSGSASDAGVQAASASGLPVPPGAATAPKPSGTAGNLSVLNWAGFTAAVSFTFDDSQPSQIAHYAELEAVGVPMTFYISTGNSTEPSYDATWTQAVQDGNEIGNHTVHHCHSDLTGCSFGTPLTAVADELDQCNAYIPAHTGQSAVWTGASPFGDTGYDSDAQSRFFIYRGVASGLIGAGASDNTDPFNLPIHLVAMGETAATMETFTSSAQTAGKWGIFLVHTITPTTAVWYNPVAITDVTATMSNAKSLNDVWVDTVANVGAYWRGQKLVSAAAPMTSGASTTWTWTLPAHFPPQKFVRVTVGGGTLSQGGTPLAWDPHGYYEVSLDAGSLTLTP